MEIYCSIYQGWPPQERDTRIIWSLNLAKDGNYKESKTEICPDMCVSRVAFGNQQRDTKVSDLDSVLINPFFYIPLALICPIAV